MRFKPTLMGLLERNDCDEDEDEDEDDDEDDDEDAVETKMECVEAESKAVSTCV
jgi:hypothetical protein